MIHFFLSFIFIFFAGCFGSDAIHQNLALPSVGKHSLKIALRLVMPCDPQLLEVTHITARAMQTTKQFEVDVSTTEQPKTKNDITQYFDKGYSFVIFMNKAISTAADLAIVEWRIYDTASTSDIVCKKSYLMGSDVRGWAYNLADELWYALKQQSSSFATKIAYVKKSKTRTGKSHTAICMANFDGSDERTIFSSVGTYVGLYWNPDVRIPSLFCSEFTPTKVRLVSITLDGKKKVVLNFQGTCVGISLGENPSDAAYCLSGAIWKFSYNPELHKSVHTCVIKNDGKNSAPTLLANGDIIFCSDATAWTDQIAGKGPFICYWHATTGKTELLTTEGYCVAPAYSSISHKIVYSKKVQGIMQLWIYDCTTKKQTAITTGPGNKLDACWSPCGNYVTFTQQEKGQSRIAIMHVTLKDRWFITSAQGQAQYPAWSPIYKNFSLCKP